MKKDSWTKPIYMCAVDYYYELGQTFNDKHHVFGSLEAIFDSICWYECGIVRLDSRGKFDVLHTSHDILFEDDEQKRKLWIDDRRTLARKRDKL